MRSWAIPTRSNRLLYDNGGSWGIRLVDAIQIFVSIGEPYRKLTVLIGQPLRFKIAFNPDQQGFRLVRNLNND